MIMMMPRRFPAFCTIVALFCAAAAASIASARTSADVSAVLSTSAVHAGDSATVAVVIDVHSGLHAQSHAPLDRNLIPLVVKLDANPTIDFKDAIYPPPQMENYPLLGTVSVYTGRVIVKVPVAVKADAALGEMRITGSVRYQACNDKACFAPETQKFEIDTQVVAAGVKVDANQPELFGGDTVAAPTTVPTTQAATTVVPVSTGSPPPPPPSRIFGRELGKDAYLLAFAGAFVVGMIFNAMPCVLPVVPLKIMGFYEVSQHDRSKSVALGAVFSAGLIASFGVLAMLVVALRVLDWGGLFQKTWFTLTIVTVLIVMATTLFGFFTVNLPNSIYRFSPRHDTYVGNFLFGVLTAALSTPCTFGMFVGLLAWALAQPATIGVALIMMVGVGMAFPYFILSAFPEVARNFPRAGPWAEVVKQMMAFLLLATAVYFAQPLYERFVSDRAFWWTLFAVIAAGGVFLIGRAFQLSTKLTPRLIAIAIALALVGPSLWATRRLTIKPFEWQPYSDQTLADARAAGKTVLIDFTASWCGNCHWVEAYVLHDPKIVRAVHDNNLVMIKADVTDETAPARPLLGKLNPAGAIPLTALYAPKSNDPRLLDGIYSVDDLLNAIAKTTGG
jgi:thiol:disulfide interchange protein DsbD